jgi:hypothetical protein
MNVQSVASKDDHRENTPPPSPGGFVENAVFPTNTQSLISGEEFQEKSPPPAAQAVEVASLCSNRQSSRTKVDS